MPNAVEIDITPIKIGDKVRVSDLTLSGLVFLDPENAVVVGVQTARAVIEEEEEEEEEEGAEGEAAEGSAESNSPEETKKDE